MDRVAVLGATGGVGRYVCEAFTKAEWEVLGYARRPVPGTPSEPLDVGAAGVAELAELFLTTRVDVVVNATGGWGTTAAEMEYAHVHLVRRLVEAVGRTPGHPRLVHVGSIHEYGDVPVGTAIDERVEPRPTSTYARTKFAGSQEVLRAARAAEVDGVVLRAVNICGPDTTTASFLGAVMAKLRAAGPGDKVPLSIAEAQRDYLDVRDLADAVLRAAVSAPTGGVYNVGRGHAVDMRELVRLVVEAAGLPADTVVELAQPVQSKGGGWTLADITAAQRHLNWTPRVSLPESLRAMWEANLVKETR